MNVSLIGYLFSVYNPVYYTLSIDIYTHRDRYVLIYIFSNCNNCGYRRRKEAAEKFSFGTILWYTSNVIFPIQFTKYIFFVHGIFTAIFVWYNSLVYFKRYFSYPIH